MKKRYLQLTLHFEEIQDFLREDFRLNIEPLVIERYGADDEIALNEAFNDWTDGLCGVCV